MLRGRQSVQLKMTTDYAMRLLISLRLNPEKRTAEELSEKMVIPRPTVIKIMSKLKAKGWVTSQEGVHGGYSLAAPIGHITLLDVFTAMEESIKINRCLEEDEYCSRFQTADCPVRATYAHLQEIVEELFRRVTLEQVLTGNMGILEDACAAVRNPLTQAATRS